jgi:hypothetical protein
MGPTAFLSEILIRQPAGLEASGVAGLKALGVAGLEAIGVAGLKAIGAAVLKAFGMPCLKAIGFAVLEAILVAGSISDGAGILGVELSATDFHSTACSESTGGVPPRDQVWADITLGVLVRLCVSARSWLNSLLGSHLG